jgi:aspartyl-tRNA(Asn)/glutamyl-tRNA(Gln) amidotransferase subunit C
MNMPEKAISRETVKKVAALARLKLTEHETDRFSRDLESILDAFRDLEKVDTKWIKPSFQPIETKNVLREDRIEGSLTQEEALANTQNKERGFFRGPKVA